ncbi:unnamed protein product, partial [Clonostachys rhizophaga]
ILFAATTKRDQQLLPRAASSRLCYVHSLDHISDKQPCGCSCRIALPCYGIRTTTPGGMEISSCRGKSTSRRTVGKM